MSPFPFTNSDATPPEPGLDLTPEDKEFLDRVAQKVVEVQMAVPAILFLESVKPLNFIGNQVMLFFNPIIQTIYPFQSYKRVQDLLERRDSIEALLVRIEQAEADAQTARDAAKAARKAAKLAEKQKKDSA